MATATAGLGSSYLWGPGVGGAQVVTKEDVLDLVINIDPYDTPFVTMAPKTTCQSTVHEWVQDSLDATATASATVSTTGTAIGAWNEGGDFYERQLSSRNRITNVCQIFRKDIKISNTMRALNPFGVADEYGYQIMRAAKEIARNMEAAVWRGASASGDAAGNTADARLLKSLEGFYGSGYGTNSAYARGTKLSNSSANAPSTIFPLRESDFNAALQVAYEAGGNPDHAFVSPSVKRYISQYGVGWTTTDAASLVGQNEMTRNIMAAERRLVRAVNIYESDFGIINIVLDRWVPKSTSTLATASATGSALSGLMMGRVAFLEMARNRVAYLRPVRHVPLPPGGDSTRGMVLGEATLEVLAEKGGIFVVGVANVGN